MLFKNIIIETNYFIQYKGRSENFGDFTSKPQDCNLTASLSVSKIKAKFIICMSFTSHTQILFITSSNILLQIIIRTNRSNILICPLKKRLAASNHPVRWLIILSILTIESKMILLIDIYDKQAELFKPSFASGLAVIYHTKI